MGLLVREDRYYPTGHDSGVSHDIDGANICIGIGTILEGELVQWFSEHDASFTSVPVSDAAEATAKFIDGSCDAMAFSSSEEVQQKKDQLDTDGSMNGVDIWVASLDAGVLGELSEVGSSISILVDQSSDEMITGVVYLLAQVTFYATCPVESTGCNEIEQTLTPESSSFEMESTCSHNVSFSWAANHYVGGQDPLFRGHGLDCTHSLNLYVSQSVYSNTPANMTGYDSEVHELSWGDWVYSIVWETRSIEQVN